MQEHLPAFADRAVAVDPFALDGHDDSQLDDLPFGVICLDGRGTILRYNLAEARLARLDRGRVLGRNFFREVAPCTATADFEGRFRAFVAGGEPLIGFPYVFDFKFGAQEVTVELVRSEDPERTYLCINRTRFLPARRDRADVMAPRQAELVPGEERLGVQRDRADQRVVAMPAAMIQALRTAWDRVAPNGWPLFTGEWGFRWGRLAVIDLETEILETHDAALRDLPVHDALGEVAAYLERSGWGRTIIDIGHPVAAARGAVLVSIERSALAEAAGRSDGPRCQLLAGFLRAFLSHVSGRLVVVRESACAAQGHAHCEMIAVSEVRRRVLDRAIEAGGGREAILDALALPGQAPATAGDVLARLF